MLSDRDIRLNHDLLHIDAYLRGLEDGMMLAQRQPDDVDRAIEQLRARKMSRLWLKYLKAPKVDPAPLGQHECTSEFADE